jgi:hypothetical protein
VSRTQCSGAVFGILLGQSVLQGPLLACTFSWIAHCAARRPPNGSAHAALALPSWRVHHARTLHA